MTRKFVEGSEAIVEAAILAGCRFFAGYPMTPFTEVLDNMAAKMPEAGGVCINAESELEAIGMTWGALATGGLHRSPLAPDVPTLGELGYRDADTDVWYAMWAPAKTPAGRRKGS